MSESPHHGGLPAGDRANRGRSDRFVWPPRESPPPHENAGAEECANAAIVPPVSGPTDLASIVAARVPPPRFPHLHAAITDIERTWLGLTRPSFFDRATQAHWHPDAAASYCPRCGVSTGEYEAQDPFDAPPGTSPKEAGCPECRGTFLPWARFIRLGEYRGLLQDAVLDIKFTRWRKLGRDVGRILGLQLLPLLARQNIDPKAIVLVPTPATMIRRIIRGIDHTLAICRGVRDVTGGQIIHALSRRHRTPQAVLARSARSQNVSGSMSATRRAKLLFPTDGPPRTIIVIDDVKTTGATLREACRGLSTALTQHGRATVSERVWVASLAVASPGYRAGGGGTREVLRSIADETSA